MKKLVMASLAVLALSAFPALVRAGHHGGCACCEAPCEQPLLHAEVTQTESTCQGQVQHGYKAVARVTESTVPCCRTVPVCVTDPCTGCTHTECKTETVLQKVKTTHIDLVPTEDCKPETKVQTCITIYVGHQPACAAPCGH
jgi:hypothetical protein